jgi:protocatechuate 3,4-dioxygenase beta subunit/putative intracellular protease/amidase
MFRRSSNTYRVGAFVLLLSASTHPSRNAFAREDRPKEKSHWNVAIVVHDQVELLDFAGPGEVFASAAQGRAFRVYTVAGSKQQITSERFLAVAPKYSIADCPKPDIVVIPGGNTPVLLNDKTMMNWLRATAQDAQIVMSVCTGAFALADLGLLDGREATTHWSALASLKSRYPKVTVRDNRRIVDNGKVITTAGVSAGIDGSLYVVARLCGLEAARRTARYMEYNWDEKLAPPSSTDKLKSPEEQAREYWFAGEWAKAAEAYQEFVKQHPHDAIAFLRLGTSQMRTGKWSQALASLEQSVHLDQDDGETLAALGRVQLQLKQAAKAAASYEKAIALGVHEFNTVYNLACAYALAGEKGKALTALEQTFGEGRGDIQHALLDPDLLSLRKEPRFRELFRKYPRSVQRITTPDEPGQPLTLRGTVRDGQGHPVAGALLKVFQADAAGRYTTDAAMDEPNARIFAYLCSDSSGRFELSTVRPGGYADSVTLNGVQRQIPAHIHINITAPSYQARAVQIVFADDPRLDAYWKEWAKKRGHPVVRLEKDATGKVRGECELILVPE